MKTSRLLLLLVLLALSAVVAAGCGDPIISGTVHGRAGQIGASIVVATLAVLAELGLSAVQRAVTPAGVKLERGVPRLGTLKRRIQTVP